MNRLHITIIILAFVVVNGYLFATNGIRIVADSERYMEYAQGLKSGFYFDPHNFWYIGYSLFILACGSNPVVIVIAQYALSLVAVFALYKTAVLLFDSNTTALIAALLFLGFIDISSWNSYVLTESLYVSCTCIALYRLALLKEQKRTPTAIVLISFGVLFTCLIKPTGIALLVAVLSVVAFGLIKGFSLPVKWSIGLAASILVLVLTNRMLTTYLVIENYKAGEVIYGVSFYPNDPAISSLIVQPPTPVYEPSADQPPVVRILSFVAHHPLYWFKLFFAKVYTLLSHTRPFWSLWHNAFSLMILIPVYVFAVVAMVKSKDRYLKLFAAVFLLTHLVSVGITSDDWDGRFLIPMLPVLFLLGSNGAISTLKQRFNALQ